MTRDRDRIRRAIGWLVATALLASSLVALSAPTAWATGPSTSSILSSVNASRANAGRPALSLRSDLSTVAYRWSQKMAARNSLQHNPSLSSQVTGWRWVGENVGYGPDWRTVQVAFMNSPAHRANILDRDYSQIGIGVVVSGKRIWITQVFRSPSGSAAASAPKKKRKKPASSRPKATAHKTRTAPRTAPRRQAPAAKPARKATPKPVPTPAQLLERRINSAAARLADRKNGDPLSAALSFADAMQTVGG